MLYGSVHTYIASERKPFVSLALALYKQSFPSPTSMLESVHGPVLGGKYTGSITSFALSPIPQYSHALQPQDLDLKLTSTSGWTCLDLLPSDQTWGYCCHKRLNWFHLGSGLLPLALMTEQSVTRTTPSVLCYLFTGVEGKGVGRSKQVWNRFTCFPILPWSSQFLESSYRALVCYRPFP